MSTQENRSNPLAFGLKTIGVFVIIVALVVTAWLRKVDDHKHTLIREENRALETQLAKTQAFLDALCLLNERNEEHQRAIRLIRYGYRHQRRPVEDPVFLAGFPSYLVQHSQLKVDGPEFQLLLVHCDPGVRHPSSTDTAVVLWSNQNLIDVFYEQTLTHFGSHEVELILENIGRGGVPQLIVHRRHMGTPQESSRTFDLTNKGIVECDRQNSN